MTIFPFSKSIIYFIIILSCIYLNIFYFPSYGIIEGEHNNEGIHSYYSIIKVAYASPILCHLKWKHLTLHSFSLCHFTPSLLTPFVNGDGVVWHYFHLFLCHFSPSLLTPTDTIWHYSIKPSLMQSNILSYILLKSISISLSFNFRYNWFFFSIGIFFLL